MKQSQIKLSIIIPAWKYRGYIEEAIDSLRKQTNQDFEVIIVSDSNKDKYEILNDSFIKHIFLDTEEHPTYKINKGFEIASGKYITVLSDDDMLEETFVEKMTFKMDKGYDIVYSDMKVFGKRNYFSPASDEWTLSQFKISTVPYITSMVTSDMFKLVDGYQDICSYWDWDFWFKCFTKGAKHYHLKEPLFLYRSTEANESSFKQDEKLRQIVLDKHCK